MTALPAISPDGRWLAYTLMDQQGEHVVVTDFPEARDTWLVAASGTGPLWHPDGTELYYQQQAPDGRVALMAVEVIDRPAFATGHTARLFEGPFTSSILYGRQYDITPDGERFLVNVPVVQSPSAPLSLVVNWTAGLK